MSTTKENINTRFALLSEHLLSSQIDVLALNPGPTLTYLTGLHFHLSERPILVIFSPLKPLKFILPKLEAPKLTNFIIDHQVYPYDENPNSWLDVCKEAIRSKDGDINKIGVEPRRMRVLELRLLEGATPRAEYVSADNLVASLRMIKDDQEIDSMQKAAFIAQDALRAALPRIKIGMSEIEVSTEITAQLLNHGSKPQLPFFPIVSAGPNSANPHATPSERKLTKGDLLVIDWGANVDGYFSDITRTFAIGEVSSEFKKIAAIVHQANRAGHEIAGPGIQANKIDRAARSIIDNAGYSKYFIHRTGHGLGMEGHEEPYIRGDNDLSLKIGMTFTIEPGIYLPNRGGVRIEDDVVITESGVRSFTDLPRELIKLG